MTHVVSLVSLDVSLVSLNVSCCLLGVSWCLMVSLDVSLMSHDVLISHDISFKFGYLQNIDKSGCEQDLKSFMFGVGTYLFI